MENAITDAFTKSVQEAVNKCMETVREESRKFAAALSAVRHLPTASPVEKGLDHRLTALELAYERQVQKTIAGLSDDIGDLDGRLAALEKEKGPEEDATPWSFGFQHAWPGPSKKNEVVVVDDKSTVLDFGSDFVVNVHHVEEDDVDIIPEPVAPIPPVASVVPVVPAPVASVVPVAPIPPVVPVVPAPVEEEEEVEEDPLELEEFEYEGETYYRDQDLNVYKPNEDGEVDAEAPIGRWLANRKTIKLWS
jgi:hypothetical protein